MSSKATAKPKEIIEEINKLRADPILYSKKVEEYSQYFTDKILKLPNLNVKIRTQEGSAPYLDTIEYLKTKEKKNALVPSKALCEIAQEIADNLIDSETGEIDEELHEQIIDKHGSFNGKFTRAMDFGGFTSEQVVINFLVCDGDEDRTQREPLLGDGLNKIGVAFGKHNIYSTICVLVTCTEFTNTKDPDDIMIFKDVDENEEIKKLEQEKLEKEKLEQEKLEQERLETEKLEQERQLEIARNNELQTQNVVSVDANSDIASYALQFVGNPYVYGGTSLTNGTDCSGFVMSVYAAFGISLPRTTGGQAASGYGVSIDEAQPGDIVSYGYNGYVSHSALYIGNGMIVHASTPELGIRVDSMYIMPIITIRRIG